MPESGKNPLSALDLPLGWNDTTIDTMNHLFRFCDSPWSASHTPGNCRTSEIPVTPMPDWSKGSIGANLVQTWRNISERVVNLYRGTPSLGDNALFNILPLISLIMGWLMTAFAVTLGAPFWFDILSRLMTVRSTLKPKDGGSGVTGFDGLAAFTDAFKPAATGNGASSVTAQLAYQPSLVASSGSGPSDDLAALRALDPAQRPRDA
jgi:hypothetical protein